MRIREVIKEERNQYTGKQRLSVSDRVNAIQQKFIKKRDIMKRMT